MATLRIPDHYPPSAREVLKWLDSRAPHISWARRFEALVEMWFAALCRDEPAYMRLVREFGSRDLLEEASRLMGACLCDVGTTYEDVLGKVYQEWSIGARSNMGQYFTPSTVADAMARMLLSDLTWKEIHKPGGFRISEPAAGAGTMLLMSIKHISQDYGPRGLANVEFHATDLDPLCCRMTALQLRWATMASPCRKVVVYQGDTLGPPEELKVMAWWEASGPPARVVRKTKPLAV